MPIKMCALKWLCLQYQGGFLFSVLHKGTTFRFRRKMNRGKVDTVALPINMLSQTHTPNVLDAVHKCTSYQLKALKLRQ